MGEMVLTMAMDKETGVAQLPAVGVNVYTAFPSTDVLMLAGFHVPVIPSLEAVGRTGAVEFWQ
jgi:hypothetical protein